MDSGFAAVEDADQLRRLMRVLSERDRGIIELQLRENRCQREIGAARPVSDAGLALDPPGRRAGRAAGEESRAIDRLRAA